jgi:acyl dehydratase
MPRYHFEDFTIGRNFTAGPRRVTRAEIITFAAEFDPQPMHLDEEAARGSLLGGLAASGWQTAAIMMDLIAKAFILDTAGMGSPGIDDLKWIRPLRPDDEVTLTGTVLEARASQTKPDRGLVRFRFVLTNQHGEDVAEHTNLIIIGRDRLKRRFCDTV